MNLHYIYSKNLSALSNKQQELVVSYLKENPKAHPKTIVAPEWFQEYLQSVLESRDVEFIKEYYNAKLLIIMDFEYLAGKEASCERIGEIIKHILRNDGMVIIESFYLLDEIDNILPSLADLIKFNGKIISV